MEEKRLVVQIVVGRREAAVMTALALVLFMPGALSTEQLTMTTYYPSPYGVYDQMRSVNSSFLAYGSGTLGVGTASPTSSNKLEVVGRTSLNGEVGLNGAYTNIYGTELSIAQQAGRGNIHVQGNENANWLRVGDAWGFNGIYSETGDLIIGSQTGRIKVGNDDSQFFSNSCRVVAYPFGSTATCPNGGVGWSAISASAVSGRVENVPVVGGVAQIVPTAGFMYCCKLQQY
ncbi:MAG: hypothetical protein HYZ75_19450 [Elusimicrobia bacterium]|nr:hypothetical protein [Elusimicrobiota bacterium]